MLRNAINRILLLSLTALAAAGCIDDDRSDCAPTPGPRTSAELLRLRVIGFTSNTDVTDQAIATGRLVDASLFLFDSDSNYLARIDIPTDSLDGYIDLGLATRAVTTAAFVSAWGNIKDNIDWLDIVPGEKMTTQFLALLDNTAADDYRMCPGEMFFGLHSLDSLPVSRAAGDTVVRSVDIKQKNARLTITVRGLPDDGATDDDYYFKLCQQNSGYCFAGIPAEDTCQIKEEGAFTASHDYVSPQPYYLIHSVDDTDVDEQTCAQIHLCRVSTDPAVEDTTVADINSVTSDGSLISLAQGVTTNVMIDLRGGTATVEVKITPWDETYQWYDWMGPR